MSWDITIMSGKDFPTDFPDVPHDWMPNPLGAASAVRRQISQIFAETVWSDPGWGRFDGGEFRIEFNIGAKDSVATAALHVRGSGDPVTPIVSLCRKNGWVAVDWSDGQLINLDTPSKENWEKWQWYRDQVVSAKKQRPDSN